MMRRPARITILRSGLWLCAAALLSLSASSLYREKQPPRVPLAERIVSVDFHDVSMRDALLQLGPFVNATVVLHQKELDKDGIPLNSRIDLHMHNVRLQTVFDRLAIAHHGVCLLEDGNVLHVTSVQSLPSTLRVYDVRDLIDRLMVSPVMKQARPDRAFLDSSGELKTHPTREQILEKIIQFVSNVVDQDGAYFGTKSELIDSVDERVIVTGSRVLHGQIEELLRRLRDAGL